MIVSPVVVLRCPGLARRSGLLPSARAVLHRYSPHLLPSLGRVGLRTFSSHRLADADIKQKLAQLHSDWEVFDEPERNVLVRNFVFDDFKQAWKFMTAAADHADKHDHHPEWFNVYSRVDVTLSTHDAGGVTEKDFELARVMDGAAGGAQQGS